MNNKEFPIAEQNGFDMTLVQDLNIVIQLKLFVKSSFKQYPKLYLIYK
jgi:hypothetical protein